MGYDANIKSKRAVKRQRLSILFSLIGLALACTFAVNFLRRSKNNINARTNKKKNVSGHLQSALAKQKEQQQQQVASVVSDGNKNLRAVVKNNNNVIAHLTEEEAAKQVSQFEQLVRTIKKTGVIMEADTESLALTSQLQDATRTLIKLRYGDYTQSSTPYRIKLDLEFQSTIPDYDTKGKDGTIVIELAPISLIPYSVYNFLEIARTWKNGAFHRNAGHVLQAIARSDVKQSMPFQEYSKEYPHKKYTVGYAGRPSGPEFYISIQDNTRAHGPGSQQQHNPYEADCIIGTVIQGVEDGTVDRIHTMPGKEFLGDKKKWVLIRRMHILVPKEDGSDEYVEFSSSPAVIPDD
jgi:cyclophilin family peptidyl-prolyl cis-trans isomerase